MSVTDGNTWARLRYVYSNWPQRSQGRRCNLRRNIPVGTLSIGGAIQGNPYIQLSCRTSGMA
jgi:hypothetical protein